MRLTNTLVSLYIFNQECASMRKTPFNGARTMPNPCYNPKTKYECPDRAPGCGQHCERWREHKTKREQIYEERKECGMKIAAYYATRKTKGRDKHYGGG